MPIETTTAIRVTCDNPSCPGHPDLSETDVAGWLQLQGVIAGESGLAVAVVGSAECLASFSNAVAAGELAWPKT